MERKREKTQGMDGGREENANFKKLAQAIYGGHLDVVSRILDENPTFIDLKSVWGKETVLHYAVEAGHDDIVSRLLAYNPQSIDDANLLGWSPFMLAVAGGREKMVAQFLAHRPKLATESRKHGWSSLCVAIENDHERVMEQLLAHDPNLVDVVVNIVTTNNRSNMPTRDVQIVELPDRLTPLHCAVRKGDDKIVARLLTLRPSLIDKVCNNGFTAFHFAAQLGHVAVASRLFHLQPQLLVARDVSDMTGLHLAAHHDHADVVEMLLDIFPPGHDLVPQLLDMQFINFTRAVLHYAAGSGSARVVSYLLARSPASIDKVTYEGWTTLHCAAAKGHVAIAEILLAQKPALIEAVATDGSTALHLAAGSGCPSLVELLLARRPELIDAEAEEKRTPLDKAVTADRPCAAVVAALLKHKPAVVGPHLIFYAADTCQETITGLLLASKPELASEPGFDRSLLLHHILGPKKFGGESFSSEFVVQVWQMNEAALHVESKFHGTPFALAVKHDHTHAIDLFQRKMSPDEIVSAFVACGLDPSSRLRPVLEEELSHAMHRDIMPTVYDYLGLCGAPNLKRQRKWEDLMDD